MGIPFLSTAAFSWPVRLLGAAGIVLTLLAAVPLLGDRTHVSLAFATEADITTTEGQFVEAEVSQEEMKSGRVRHHCRIRAGYWVDGRLHEVNVGLNSFDADAVERACNPYRNVEQVPVYYLTASPERASLRREDFGAWGRAVLYLLCLPAGIASLVAAVRLNRRDLR